ncbi:MAG TPA: DivIVA domain-containing protein [Longimicrobiales bacterium]
MIDLTPLEVRKKKGDFRRAMRGYDAELVDDFLDLVADRLEQLVRENMALQERIAQQNAQVADYRDRERALTEALVSAQEMREEVRRQATKEAELAKRGAEQHAEQLRAQVEEEVRQLRSTAQQESSRVLTSIREERVREEEMLRQLRARQQEFLASYRAFLEEELAELVVLTRTTGSPVRGAGARTAPAAAVAEPGSAPLAEPFEPEPFEPESFVEEESELVSETLHAEEGLPVEGVVPGTSDETEVSGGGSELRLYDSIAPEESGDGVTGAIGLGAAEPAWPGPPDWSMPDLDLVDAGHDGEDIDLDEEDDPETLALLRNAAAAGYRLTPEEPDAEELLLDEAVAEEPAKPDEPEDDGWLPTLLEDEK